MLPFFCFVPVPRDAIFQPKCHSINVKDACQIRSSCYTLRIFSYIVFITHVTLNYIFCLDLIKIFLLLLSTDIACQFILESIKNTEICVSGWFKWKIFKELYMVSSISYYMPSYFPMAFEKSLCFIVYICVLCTILCFICGKKGRFSSSLLLVTGKQVHTKCLLKLTYIYTEICSRTERLKVIL